MLTSSTAPYRPKPALFTSTPTAPTSARIRVDGRRDLCLARDIHAHRPRTELCQVVHPLDVTGRRIHLVAVLDEAFRNRLAHPRGCAGHERGLLVSAKHVVPQRVVTLLRIYGFKTVYTLAGSANVVANCANPQQNRGITLGHEHSRATRRCGTRFGSSRGPFWALTGTISG